MRRWFMKRSRIQHENAWKFMLFSCIVGCKKTHLDSWKNVKTYLLDCRSGILPSFAMVWSIMVCLWGHRSMYVSGEYYIWYRSSKQVNISLWHHSWKFVFPHITTRSFLARKHVQTGLEVLGASICDPAIAIDGGPGYFFPSCKAFMVHPKHNTTLGMLSDDLSLMFFLLFHLTTRKFINKFPMYRYTWSDETFQKIIFSKMAKYILTCQNHKRPASQVHFYHARGATPPLALHALLMGCLGNSWSAWKNLDVNLFGKQPISISQKHLRSQKTLFGGVERLLDSSSAMAVVPFSGDDPLEDRGFMPFAKAFAETSRFKDVPRI